MSYKRYDIITYTPTTTTTPFPFPPPFFDDITLTTLDVTPFPFHPVDLLYTETRAVTRITPTLSHLKSISDRVSSLEARFDRLLSIKEKEKEKTKPKKDAKKKYTWTYEVEGDRKDTWTAEKKGSERKYKWCTEINKGGGDDKKVYTWKAVIGGGDGEKKVEKKEKESKKKKKSVCAPRVVEIEEEEEDAVDHRAVVLRQAFTKRAGKNKGKKKELSPMDAAVLIQRTFKAYLIRRSKALRALRELAVAKTKLKELRALFHNFSYRNRVSRDAEERQKFSEKIIVLLLTVDSIEGVDIMVRAAKRSMVDELEAMLDVVDPRTTGRSLSIRRRTFDMPSGTIQKEIAEGVAQVVQMLEEENTTFEACV